MGSGKDRDGKTNAKLKPPPPPPTIHGLRGGFTCCICMEDVFIPKTNPKTGKIPDDFIIYEFDERDRDPALPGKYALLPHVEDPGSDVEDYKTCQPCDVKCPPKEKKAKKEK